MTTLCIQIQPHRVSGLDVGAIQTACENIASDRNLVRDFCIVTGDDATEYVNLMFETDRTRELWELLHDKLYAGGSFDKLLARCSMVICEGNDGWNDYLLLHHWDRTLELDSISTGQR